MISKFLYLKEIENRLVNYNPNESDLSSEDSDTLVREEYEVEMINLESAKAFRAYGGVKVRDYVRVHVLYMFSQSKLMR